MDFRQRLKGIPRATASLVVCILLVTAYSAIGQDIEEAQATGLEIAMEADRRDSGFGDTSSELVMVMTSSDDTEIVREMRQMTLEVEEDGDKSIMVFDRPRDLKGTAILTHTHKFGSDDQWLYLPALKRVKRISSSDKSGPFMGSEFAYEDLASQEVEKFKYRYLRNEALGDMPCFIVERIPVDSKSGYTRQLTWIDHDEYRIHRIDYYDRRGDLLKSMYLRGYEQYLDRYWRASEMVMQNHQSGKSTTLNFTHFTFRHGLTENDFNRSSLAGIR